MKRSNFKKKAMEILLNSNRIILPCLKLDFAHREEWIIADEEEFVYENSSFQDGVVILYKNKEPKLKIYIIAEKSESMLEFLKESQAVAILQIDITKQKTYISDEELENLILIATTNKQWILHPKVEECESKLFWAGDPICIVERGCALHVDNCPKGARYYGVQSYANYIDDCSYCEYRYERQRKFDICVGKLKVLNKDDLYSIIDIEREDDYITASSHIGGNGETIRIVYTTPQNSGKTLQELWEENGEKTFAAKNLSNFLVQIDESPLEMAKKKGDCYGIALSSRMRYKIHGWNENIWEFYNKEIDEIKNKLLQKEKERELEKECSIIEKQRLIEEENQRIQAQINELLENPCFPLSKEDIRKLASIYSDQDLRLKIRNIIKTDMDAGGKNFDELTEETKYVESSLHTVLCAIFLNIKVN